VTPQLALNAKVLPPVGGISEGVGAFFTTPTTNPACAVPMFPMPMIIWKVFAQYKYR